MDGSIVSLYIVNESSRASAYGIGTYIRELSSALKGSGFSVCLVHLRSGKPEYELENADGIQRLYIPAPVSRNASKDYSLYYRNVVYLLQLQIKEKNGLVFHLNYNKNEKLAEALKKAFCCRIVTSIHYLDWCFTLSGNVSRFRKILASKNDNLKKTISEPFQNEKKFFETVDHIICLSEHTRQILQNDYQIPPIKTTIIYNGLTDNCFMSEKQKLRLKYHISDIPIILFVGRLEDNKGLTYALRAFKTILNTQYAHFIIAGNGTFDTFMKECEDIWMHVTWTGRINKEKLYDLYSIADIGVMPSFHEQCSYVAIEMMMHGIPMIVSSGLKEMVENEVTGLHIPIEEQPEKVEIDSALLAEKILFLLQHHDERKRMGDNARKRYETMYSADVFRQKMLDFYNFLFL